MLNLSVLLEATAASTPSAPAFTFGETTLTYAQVNGAANQVANGLISKGINQGDKVALSCLNLPYFPIAYFGILKAGATVVPLSVLLKKDEIAYHLSDSDAKAYFCFIGTPDLPMLEMGHAGFSETDSCKHLFAITANPTDASPIDGIPTMGSLMAGQSPTLESVMTGADESAVI
ncbi:MAG: AMP-binding protein, partial [Saprospiraceae bacterium]|nr:AMP-binding protein [Saprospiraceae bacterium]